jgi:hypothetical protein
MITEYDTETATLVLPVSNISMFAYNRINRMVGSGTLVEINFDTENFTEFHIDYSLCEFEDIADVKSHLTSVCRDMVDFLGCECNHTYKDAWLKESAQQEVA